MSSSVLLLFGKSFILALLERRIFQIVIRTIGKILPIFQEYFQVKESLYVVDNQSKSTVATLDFWEK